MELEGRKIVVNKSISELKEMLNKPHDYKHLMPDNLKSFEATDNGFNFELFGLPKIGLLLENSTNNNEVILKSANPSLDFNLKGVMNPVDEGKTDVQLFFTGNFNPFIKMMAQKPLQNFINVLTDKIEQL